MSNRIHAIKIWNWLFLRIKPSEYDPTKPLTFAGGFDGTAGDNLEQLETLQNDLAELGDQVSEIQHVVPSTANTNNLLATMADGNITGGNVGKLCCCMYANSRQQFRPFNSRIRKYHINRIHDFMR